MGSPTLVVRLAVGRVHVESGVDHELHPGGVEPVGAERVRDALGRRPLLLGVGKQFEQRRLVGDQRPHPAGVHGDQCKAGDGATAGPEEVGRRGAEVVEDGDDVVGAQLGSRRLAGIVDRGLPRTRVGRR